jgi:hypothetical protein
VTSFGQFTCGESHDKGRGEVSTQKGNQAPSSEGSTPPCRENFAGKTRTVMTINMLPMRKRNTGNEIKGESVWSGDWDDTGTHKKKNRKVKGSAINTPP